MFDVDDAASPRRTFLGTLAGGAALLLAGAGRAGASGLATLADDDEWLKHLHGTERQFFDAVTFNDAAAQTFAVNYMSTMKATYKLSNADVCAVVGLRHFAIVPAFNDAMWQKYKVGEFFKINDPKTKAPATRNFTNSDASGDLMFPGSSIGALVKAGAVVTVCNVATSILPGLLAKAAGLSISSQDAYKEWSANLLPGCYLVPSGVLAVHKAQTTGRCTYCAAG